MLTVVSIALSLFIRYLCNKKNFMKIHLKITLLTLFFSSFSYAEKSKVWVADNGDGTFKNPVLYADYSDPDIIRVGKDYWMTASSFNCIPGLPILHSNDLVNWKIVNYALPRLFPEKHFSKVQHGDGVWAPSIRYHKGEFFIYWGDPDFGMYMIKTTDPKGKWSEPICIKEGKGLIDCCPFWDNDGRVYLSHAYAGSRAGLKSIVAVCELNETGDKVISESRIVFDGHKNHPTVEGTKLYKRNGYYYIFVPAGGVKTGWQLVLRSKNIYGPYEEKIVLAQGNSPINGPHQGAWIDTPNKKEDWFAHFQDVYTVGRIMHLQPMIWKNDWPIIGLDPDGDGCGEPVLTYKKPNVGKTYPINTPVEEDNFDNNTLGLQWQWHANPSALWYFCDKQNKTLRLFSYFEEGKKNLWEASNLLLQKITAPKVIYTTKIAVFPDKRYVGERFSFVIMGEDYATLSITNTKEGLSLSMNECKKARKEGKEIMLENIKLPENEVYLRIKIENGKDCTFFYSTDGNTFFQIGNNFEAKPGRWIGAKVGFVAERPKQSNDGGYMDIKSFTVE